MTKTSTYFHALNIGVQDKRSLARVDLERMRLAAEEQTNLLCLATGPAFMRPGLEYLAPHRNNAEAWLKEFVFGASDVALLELSNYALRVILDDAPIRRTAASCTVTNGDFNGATGWDTAGFGGGAAIIASGTLTLNALHVGAIAQCRQTVATGSPGVEHALRIGVVRGPVRFRCGSSLGAEDYIPETDLPTGTHSLAFTPTGTFYIEFSSKAPTNRIVDAILIEPAGEMVLPTQWPTEDLSLVRMRQSADVCFAACKGYQQSRIERRGRRSWSVAVYQTDNGPFASMSDGGARLRPTVLQGSGALASTVGFFTPSHIGALFRLDHGGQRVTQSLSSDDTYTDPIRVTGLTSEGNDRDWNYEITGTWSGTISIQRSYDGPDTGFIEVEQITANPGSPVTYTDEADNAIYWYRLGFRPNTFVSGVAEIEINYDGGGGYGICRVTDYVSPTFVYMDVLTPFKATVFTRDWREGAWSSRMGWPSSVELADGRLWWAGQDKVWGSESDAFPSFDLSLIHI